MDYYDPQRQEDPLEHDGCCVEDGDVWFGHGMICNYPELHKEWMYDPERESWYFPATNTTIKDDDMPWELKPKE